MTKLSLRAAVTLAVLLVADRSAGEDLLRYRGYVLGSSLAVVAQTSGVTATEARTLYQRPMKIEELKWRAPYLAGNAVGGDPVRDIAFKFADGELYQIVVAYERTRIEGLTDADLIDVVSAAYGDPTPGHDAAPREPASDTVVIASWNTPSASVVLIRGTVSPALQLVLTSTTLHARARAAMTEAVALETRDAPQRAIDERDQRTAAAAAAQVKARLANKPAFRP